MSRQPEHAGGQTVPLWRAPPDIRSLAAALAHRPQQRDWAVCLPDTALPQWPLPTGATAGEVRLRQALDEACRTLQFAGANLLADILPGRDLWLLPSAAAAAAGDYFAAIDVQDGEPWACRQPENDGKPWLGQPESPFPEHVLVIGAGIAGAATAYELARRGVKVSVFDAAPAAAHAASGNRQGLLYAKISAHDTAQTELLLCGYGYSRRLLAQLLPEHDCWGGDGVLHLDYNDAERRRHDALAAQTQHRHLYRRVGADEAAAIAGISIGSGALYWPQGVWLNPPALVTALLAHENITFLPEYRVQAAAFDGENWQIDTGRGRFAGSHIVLCTGAGSLNAPLLRDFPLQTIRGQTSLAAATAASRRLRAALSGESYISPAWRDAHCYGASFVHHDEGSNWREADENGNRAALAKLNPELFADLSPLPAAASLKADRRGHAALRCDSYDHLPLSGALADAAAMRRDYAKLALDKNYRLAHIPCPWLPQAYANTAHGSRGLATAPLCAADIAAQICGHPRPLSPRLRRALHPNRVIARSIVHGRENRAV